MPSVKVEAEGKSHTFSLDRASITFGRGLESDVRLHDVKASRRHCQIIKTTTGYRLIDLASGNGTYVNGVQVTEHALTLGDKIQIGTTTILFDPQGGPAPSSSPEEKPPSTRAIAPPTAQTKIVRPTGLRPVVAEGASAAQAGLRPVVAEGASAARASLRPASSPGSPKPTAPTTQTPGSRIGVATRSPSDSTRRLAARSGARPATSRIQQAVTGKTTTLRGTTQKSIAKTEMTRRGTTRSISKTQRYTQAATAKPKVNPVAALLGAAGLVIVGVVLLVALSGKEEGHRITTLDQYDKLVEEARQLDREGNYEDAIDKAQKALDLIREDSGGEFVSQKRDVKVYLKELEDRIKAVEDLETDYKKAKEFFDNDELRNTTGLSWVDLGQKCREITRRADRFPQWSHQKALQEMMEKIERRIGIEIAEIEGRDANIRITKNRKQFISDEKNEWGPAILDLQEFLKENPGLEGPHREKVKSEIGRYNARANEECRKKFEKRVERGDVTVEELRKHRDRFVGTDCLSNYDDLIRRAGQGE